MEKGSFTGEDRLYIFDKLPENIKQIGEQPDVNRIYVEDYVVTYMHRIFREKAENALVVFVGKKGEGTAKGSVFLYGAIEVEMDLLLWKEQFTAQVWDDVHQQVHQYFSGGEVMGWGCGVNIGNSQIKKAVAGIQRKHFSREGQVLFYWDYSEEEESVCRWEQGGVQSIPGYLIYYGKNPKMQEYMLRGEKKESFEAGYRDTVMENVRTVIQKKEQMKQEKKPAFYAAGGMLLLLALLGGWLLVQSSRKIENLESAIMTLSQEPLDKASMAPESRGKSTSPPASTGEFADFEKKSLDLDEKSEDHQANQGGNGQSATSKKPAENSKPAPTKNSAASPKPSTSSDSAPSSKPASSRTPISTQKPVATKKPAGGKTVSDGKNNSSVKGGNTGSGNKTGVRPAGTVQGKSYVVQKGDTLSQIVWRQYHTTAYIERVKQANNIENEHEIQVGQRIILPLYEK